MRFSKTMENDFSFSKIFGGLRIANPDREPPPCSPTDSSHTSQPAVSKTTTNDCPPQSRRISLLNIPFLSRGSTSSDASSAKSHSQSNDHRLARQLTDDRKSDPLGIPPDTLNTPSWGTGITKANRQSLPNNYQKNKKSTTSLNESNWHNSDKQHLTDQVRYMSPGAQARDSIKSQSVVQACSQELIQNLTQPQGILHNDLSHQENSYNRNNYSRNITVSSNISNRETTESHYSIGSSHTNGISSRNGLERNSVSSNIDWRDKGAAVGVREEYDATGKLVLRQIKKGVRDFEFGRVLGEGSYSQVVLGKDKQTSKEYAIKILDKKHIIKEKKVKYVNIEKDTLNRLIEHPGIVRLYYTFQDSTSLYYVLDVASGGELLGVLKRVKLFDEECTRFYGAQILDAIEHMHNRGVIHRDLKPENLLVNDQMHIKITDFGTAKLLPDPRKTKESFTGCDSFAEAEESMRAKSFVGTAEYVSPELLTEKSACKASDLWAYGCILFQLLAGRPPFKAGNDYQTFQKIVNLDFEYPSVFPPIARDLIDRLLVLDPQKRLTIEHIKTHPFFEGIQWGRGLWKQKAPRLKPYVPYRATHVN